MEYEVLRETEHLVAHWYPKRGLLHAMFIGELLPEVSAEGYKLSGELIAKYGTEKYRAVITDFSKVTKFPNANTTVTRNQSRRINDEIDLSGFPIALLVDTIMQESFVWMIAKGNGTTHRSKIVRSLEDAFAFIDEYHAKQDAAKKHIAGKQDTEATS
jgi:hypothetical protein